MNPLKVDRCPLVKPKDKKMWRTKMKVLKVALFDLKRCNFMTPKCHSFFDIIYEYSNLNVFSPPTCNREKHTNILKTNDQAFFFHVITKFSRMGRLPHFLSSTCHFTYINPVEHLIISCFSFQYKSPKFFVYSSKMLNSVKTWPALSKGKLDILKTKKGNLPIKK